MVYEQFGSQQALLPTEKQKCKPAELTNGSETTKDWNSKERRELRFTLRVCYVTLIGLLLMLIAIIVVASFYISHLQKRDQDLQTQAQDLAAKFRSLETHLERLNERSKLQKESNTNEATNTKRYDTSIRGTAALAEQIITVEDTYRAKRSADCSAYDKDSHGIGERNIAYVSISIESLNEMISTTDTGHSNYFTESRRHSQNVKGCDGGQLMIKDDNTYWWCKQSHARQKDTMMLARGNHKFKYFTPAPWMNEPCYNRFEFKNGELIVKQPGMYIVHTNIHFTDKSREPGYGVYYKRGEGSEEETELISKCQVSATDKVGSGIFPCPTWQMIPLKADDRVYMTIPDYNWFTIEEAFHLALVKLSD